jgi:signal transduction histidine kinase
MFRIGTFELTPAEVAKRKGYLELTPADERRLREAHPYLQKHAQSIIDRFYDYLLGHEHTRAMLTAPGLVERLKKLQTQYFIELTSGEYDLAYFENRLRVGQVHHRIGLAPEWYLGAYIKYLHIASDILSSAFARDHERFFQTLISLTKIISLDKGLALDAYHFSAQEGLEKKTLELEKTNEELQRLQAAKRQLTDMIVHDLQNPLTGLASAIQVIRSTEPGVSESTRQALAEATRRCDDLSQMIMNVLQVSRGESGELPTYLENLDIAQISRREAESFRSTAELEGREVVVESPPTVLSRSDQTLLKRILQNLIRNALRHTPRGTKVIVRVTPLDDQRTRVSVLDDGPGIPKAVQAHLFEPFGAAALRSAGVRVDTGLGLPSCLVMARALGAELSVDSDGRSGSVFSLLLPVSPPATS